MSAMRQEWIEFCRQNKVHNGRPDYAIVRTAFYAGWTRAVKRRLDLPDPPEPEDIPVLDALLKEMRDERQR